MSAYGESSKNVKEFLGSSKDLNPGTMAIRGRESERRNSAEQIAKHEVWLAERPTVRVDSSVLRARGRAPGYGKRLYRPILWVLAMGCYRVRYVAAFCPGESPTTDANVATGETLCTGTKADETGICHFPQGVTRWSAPPGCCGTRAFTTSRSPRSYGTLPRLF